MTSYVQGNKHTGWTAGNDQFEIQIKLNDHGLPRVCGFIKKGGSEHNWAPTASEEILGPVIKVGNLICKPHSEEIVFSGVSLDQTQKEIVFEYTASFGLTLSLHLKPSAENPVLESWMILYNTGSQAVTDISRFDALNMSFGTSGHQPQAAYLGGWLDGPRADAPGRPAVPYPYDSWIPTLLYGKGAPLPAPPQGGWISHVLKLVREPLTRLPLQSGKRSTYDNHPWVVLMDPGKKAGIFAGFLWSGTWKMDIAHEPSQDLVTMEVFSDGCVHTLKSGDRLVSPRAFVGLFSGDWDDAFYACSQYVSKDILPPKPENFPLLMYNFGVPSLETVHYDFGTSTALSRDVVEAEAAIKANIDLAAKAGMECYMIDAAWWSKSPDAGDFSYGLGDFEDHKAKVPGGLKAISDYVHSKGMKFGLWFEFERVDIRTANLGRNPWSPEWMVHQQGYPYRSWCQHVYCLCLGVRAAAEWALENVSWAIEAYGVDWMKIDSNEWAVCDDPTHDHGERDGEWAQVQGLYYVMDGLKQRYPHLIVENCAGGSQRGDLGFARYSNYLGCHDHNYPSAKTRQYSHGGGSIYPQYFTKSSLPSYQSVKTGPDKSVLEDRDRLEFRALSRMMGLLEVGWGFADQNLLDLKELIDFYKAFRPALCGRRRVLMAPADVVEKEKREQAIWEAYQYTAENEHLHCLFVFRCMSPLDHLVVKARGMDRAAIYRVRDYRNKQEYRMTGEELMNQGIPCQLDKTRMANVYILSMEGV